MKRADSRSRRTEAELHSSWMLSFGDLLTLLLCFFLCILSFSPLNPHRRSEDIDKHNQIVALSAAEPQGGGSVPGQTGTALAELQAEAREFGTLAKVSNSNELVLTLSDSDFAGGGWEATPAVLSRVKSQVIETSYAVLGVKVESCFPERGRAEEAAWAGSISRILGMRGQLIDAGVSAALLKYRPLGPHCEALQGDEARQEPTVTRITIERGLRHG